MNGRREVKGKITVQALPEFVLAHLGQESPLRTLGLHSFLVLTRYSQLEVKRKDEYKRLLTCA